MRAFFVTAGMYAGKDALGRGSRFELGFAHYETMQRMGLDRATISAIGGEVG